MAERERAQFDLNDRRVIGQEVWYCGRLIEGQLRKGDLLCAIQRTRATPLPELGRFQVKILETVQIELVIASIEIHGREIELLDKGYSCGLCLTGEGLDLLRDCNSERGVSTYDVLLGA